MSYQAVKADAGDKTCAGGTGGAERAVTVRDATADDLPDIHRMIHELAAHLGMPDGPLVTVEELRADGFECRQPWFLALVAETGGRVVGYALCNRAYATWTRRALYLEDLYVERAARRSGAGLALMRAICTRAQREGVTRLDWHVLHSNRPARTFYAGLGARDLLSTEGRLAMRLDAPAITALARSAQHPAQHQARTPPASYHLSLLPRNLA